MDYRVELDNFRGPMDLLLWLVKHNEVDIYDIPIAIILEQFNAYLDLIQFIDVELAGEFLLTAATLMEIKSRMLLPRVPEAEAADEDPRLELVKQLIEYKKYKEAAALLERQAEKQLTRLARLPSERPAFDPAQQPLRKVELWDLVSAFGRLMRETIALQPKQIIMDETPIQVHMERILDRLRHAGRLSFADVFTPPHTRGRLLGIFLAILELIKGRKIQAEQAEPFDTVWIVLAPPVMADDTAAPVS
ncbi:MAG: segregation/condensation protein A [Gemmataceae bacterium]|nr:segregation/condensation protein A [Gemmataceae bacterium]